MSSTSTPTSPTSTSTSSSSNSDTTTLYLFTFLATILILVLLSASLVLRSYILRRRAPLFVDCDRVRKCPVLWDIWIHDQNSSFLPVAVRSSPPYIHTVFSFSRTTETTTLSLCMLIAMPKGKAVTRDLADGLPLLEFGVVEIKTCGIEL